MSEIFDLTHLKTLIGLKKIPAVIVVDTNVLMDNPDLSTWHTDLKDPVFVLPYSIIGDLNGLLTKQPPHPNVKAIQSRDALLALTDEGDCSKGIYRKGIGWFIMLKPPSAQLLEQELDKYKIVAQIVHKTDTSFLLIHNECSAYFRNTVVLLLTGDKTLTLLARAYNPFVYNAQSFPLKFGDWIKSKLPQLSLDPDKELNAAIKRLEQKVIKVRFTLISKRFDQDWDFGPDYYPRYGAIIAEGEGILRHPELGNISFTWKMPYKSGTSRILAEHPLYGEADISEDYDSNIDITPEPILNFLGRKQEIPQALCRNLEQKLTDLADPLNIDISNALPSLQNPICHLEYFMKMMRGIDSWKEENDKRKMLKDTSIKPDADPGKFIIDAWNNPNVFESFEDFHEYYSDFLLKQPKDQIVSYFDMLLGTWNVGHYIDLVLPPSESPSTE